MRHLGLILILLAAFSALGAIPATTTPGPLVLSSTFECISVRGWFTNDANGNNAATLKFRVTGAGAYKDAYTPIIDRITDYANQCRGAIVGLTPNTAYEVVATWTDADGIVGDSSVTGTVSTVSYTPPTGGTTNTVSTDAELASALSSVSAGQTIHINAGTYKPFTVSVGGNAGAYVRIEGDSGGGTIVRGTNINQNISVPVGYVILSHLTLSASDHYGIVCANGLSGIWIQDCALQDVSSTSVDIPSETANYADTGILFGAGSSNLFVLRNSILSPTLTAAPTFTPTYDGPGTGIGWGTPTYNLVIQSNLVVGGFRDGISIDGSGAVTENVDLCGNIVSGCKDDAIESKGYNINTRIFGNWITNGVGNTFFACNENVLTTPPGPLYVFRNYGKTLASNTQANMCYKLGNYVAPSFFFHNTIDATTASPAFDGFTPGSPITAKNNITATGGSCIDYAPSASVFDYNLYYKTGGSSFVYLWNGTTSYDTLGDFRTGTGQEANGLSTNPNLNADLTIPGGSAAKDAGTVLANFNDAGSAWPYSGTAPDMGAYEYNGGSPPTPTTCTTPKINVSNAIFR